MANDPRDRDGSKLARALQLLGANRPLRDELMQWLKQAERRLDYTGATRDDITGPIIDALHTDDDRYVKTLADGTRFEFLYRTKIARDFILSEEEHPTHVWEPQTTRLLQYLAGAMTGDVLIGGAYFGDHAILLARQLAATSRLVHCFEPNPAQAGMLEHNAQLNALRNIRLERAGLWHEAGQTLRLDGFDSFANAVPTEGTDEGEGFHTVTIDQYCQDHHCHLGVVMLDIEGAELHALQGAMHVLREDQPAVVFEVHRDYVDWSGGLARTPICSLLAGAGYRLFAVRDFNSHQEMGARRIELIPVDSVYLEGPPHGFNMLAAPPGTLLEDPLFRIVENVSPKLLRHKAPALHHPFDGLPG